MRQLPNLAPPLPVRILFCVVGGVFSLIGLLVLGFLWTSDAPFFFCIVGSLIAIVFVFFGATMAFSFLKPRALIDMTGMQNSGEQGASQPGESQPTTGYTCPNCSATLGKEAEVSPMGDVKCSFCGRWFNIHNRA